MAKRKTDPTRIQLMDTTLRDGEQTPDVAYTPAEKLQLAKLLLLDVGVDRIEIASTRVSEGEREAVRLVADWARKRRLLSRVEILGYADGRKSPDWISETGGRVLNLLTKGSETHCRKQLGMEPARHRDGIAQTVRAAQKQRITVNAYLEDWSSGVRDSFPYLAELTHLLIDLGCQRIYLPDTLGVFSPTDVDRYVGLMVGTWPHATFEFHGHNDYGLSTANVLAAVRAGASGIHTSVNGMGERTGNTRLAETVAVVHDHTSYRTGVDETRLADISRMVEALSGKDVAANTPIVGRDVFTHAAGIHSDGDLKGDLYTTRLAPKRFGQKRRYALGKLSGKASIDANLKTLGIDLAADERALVLQRVIELGDKKHTVTPQDLPYIIADVLKSPEHKPVRVLEYAVSVGTGRKPAAEVVLSVHGRRSRAAASGDGGYDAFMNALKKAAKKFALDVPRLSDYRVRIPPGGRTGALVETVIAWRSEDPEEGTFSTLGVDSDQLGAAVIATEKMLNAIAPPKPAAQRRPGRKSTQTKGKSTRPRAGARARR
ncbi:MAG: 2-isopropylmalate synthase [Deltaproteobacteria bacterium]|nr:2-isopropylmalate synthase [Deltaproteobacteria bacterium]MBW2359584.1 2-isopropylmalate synthase [Deltaproteobacteria bacterium]